MNRTFLNEQFHALQRLWRHPRMTREDVLDFQNRKLRRLLSHAGRNVAYYRDLFEQAGISPSDIRTSDDLRLLPLTTKEDLRKRPLDQILAAGIRSQNLVNHQTSGSSGQPFEIYRSMFEEHLLNQFRIRARRMLGVRVRDRITGIREIPAEGRRQQLAGRLRQALGIYRYSAVNCYLPPEQLLRETHQLDPDVLASYPSVLARMAECAHEGLPAPSPRLVLTGAEVLGSGIRRQIAETFGAPVWDFYGASEFNILAWECPETGHYNVCDDNVVLEILKDGQPVQPGETGEVVVTGLHQYAMPLIRFRIGDMATRGCDRSSSGLPFSTIAGIQGRTVEFFRLPGGRYVHPWEIITPMFTTEAHWVRQHQLIQETEDRVRLLIQPLQKPSPEALRRIREWSESRLPRDVGFELEFVESFHTAPGTKFSPYVPLSED